MKSIGIFLLAVTALTAGTDDPLGPKFLMSGSGGLKSGITIRFATYLVPGGPAPSSYGEGGITAGSDAVHRYMKDPTSGMYFGYDLTVTGDGTTGYQAAFRPLSDVPGTSRAITPKLPPAQSVRDGDTMAVEIMVSPDGSQRMVDYLQIFLNRPTPRASTSKTEPRDFTVDDGAVTYDTSSMTFWINGQQVTGLTGFTGNPGATFWIAFPNRGRYILSLVPHEGFQKSGVARENVLSFHDGDQGYEIRFMSPIAGGNAWNLYVLRDETSGSNQPMREAVKCGTDRLDNLVAKHE